jgi:cytochrome P450
VAFTRRALEGYIDDMARLAEEELDQWPDECQDGSFDITDRMARFALRVASCTLLGTDLAHRFDEIRDATITVVDTLTERMSAVAKPPWFLPLPAHRRCRRALKCLDDIVYGVVEQRRKEGLNGDDILSRILRGDGTTETAEDPVAIRDNAITFLIAGSESSAASLAWTADLVSRHPEVMRRLHQEVTEVLGERSRPSAADVMRMSYTMRVVQESMRLYPPSWIFDRQAIADDELCGYQIKRGSILLMVPYHLHRSPELWYRPEAFDPERFQPEAAKQRHEFSYLPFSGGPRKCIGDRFSVIESTILLAMLAQRWNLEATSPAPPAPVPSIALRPSGPIQVRLKTPSK